MAATYRIPTLKDAAATRTRVELDGTTYLIDLVWNGRSEAWYLSLYTDTEEPIVAGLKVVSNRGLLERFRYLETLPRGEIMAWDATGKIAAAGYDELGTSIPLFYFDAETVTLVDDPDTADEDL